jgi:hypothetical protein
MNFVRRRGGASARAALLAAAAVLARTALAQAPVLEPAPAGTDAAELSRRAAATLTGERTYFEAALQVGDGGKATQEEVVLRAWSERRSGQSFLRVLAPAREAGTGFLRLPPVVWRYAPREEDIESLTPEALRAPWLGSGFRLVDLQGPLAGLGSAPAQLLGVDATAEAQGGERAFVIELRQAADAGGGRVIAWLSVSRATPQRLDWRDAQDALVATLRFDDVREIGERAVPHRWTLTHPAQPRQESRLELREIRFDPRFDDALFTTRQLLQRGDAPAGTPQGARLPPPGGGPE